MLRKAKITGSKRPWPFLRNCPCSLLEGLREATKIWIDYLIPSWDWNRESIECLPTHLQRRFSVKRNEKIVIFNEVESIVEEAVVVCFKQPSRAWMSEENHGTSMRTVGAKIDIRGKFHQAPASSTSYSYLV